MTSWIEFADCELTQELEDMWVASTYEQVGHELETIINLGWHSNYEVLTELLELP